MEAMVVIVWLISGIVCASIASNKGHSSCSGFTGGCLFGIFGLIYWAVAKDRKAEDAAAARHAESMYQLSQATRQQPQRVQQVVKIRCKRCGSLNNELNEFCTSCGDDLDIQ